MRAKKNAWSVDNLKDGSLRGISNKSIARAAGYEIEDPNAFVRALEKVGLIERKWENLFISDFDKFKGE